MAVITFLIGWLFFWKTGYSRSPEVLPQNAMRLGKLGEQFVIKGCQALGRAEADSVLRIAKALGCEVESIL